MMRHLALALALAASGPAIAADDERLSGSITGYYYAMRDQPDFGVGVATLDYRRWHFEARYNYEAENAGSAFVGYKFKGGDSLTFEITPIVGALFGSARGVVPGLEASVAWRSLDAYVEAEYVDNRRDPGTRYWYAWSEIGWTPVEWMRVGLVGQRTNTVDTGRELQRGAFAQVTVERLKFGVYFFNPDSAARYVIGSLGLQF
jgi:hypothetical protein